jgi:hypothetical protein
MEKGVPYKLYQETILTDFNGNETYLGNSEISISNDINSVGATCEIKFPMNTVLADATSGTKDGKNFVRQPVTSVVQVGYYIKVIYWLRTYKNGEPFDLEKQIGFIGNVTNIIYGNTGRIICKDLLSYNFSQGILTKSWNTEVKLSEILEYLVEGTNKYLGNLNPPQPKMDIRVNARGGDVKFSNYYIIKATPLQVIQKLKSDTGLLIFSRDNTSNGVLNYHELISTTVKSESGINGNVIFSDILNVFDRKIQKPNSSFENFTIKVNRTDPTTKKKSYFFVYIDKDGKTQYAKDADQDDIAAIYRKKEEIHASNMSEDDARTLGEAAIYKNIINQNIMNMATTIYPSVQPLDVVDYESADFPELNASYLVKSVNKSFGSFMPKQKQDWVAITNVKASI